MNLLDIIKKAGKEERAIGHFNVGSFDMFPAIARAASGAPVVIGVSEGERAHLGLGHAKDMARSFGFFLNADHTRTVEGAREAARAGCDMIVFDAADKPFPENVRLTREAVIAAKRARRGVVMEGELGYIGGSSSVFDAFPQGVVIREEDMPTPDMAARFVKETGVDLLAPAVGNVHGMIRPSAGGGSSSGGNPALSIRRIKELRAAIRVPLVLHGGSGIPDEGLRAAVQAGISMVHVSTELRLVWRTALQRALAAHSAEISPAKFMPEVLSALEELVARKMKLFGYD
ncbi:hypothetical protein A2110_01460 [Candidatus Jorgensenbacteria bacterium GWA1_54_12]|uniref:Tagatose-bisphosphate aldolase n=1 Tax=Candidatus Jorgensenbacteria bacterium GWA1_54_12 TaxID=1798468 RepID=A0A1F6BLB4_9BACT|nr:MAG: hypothetical protein A2110_01460 [Candidatus Jorgensenbacteria bacterium GWA1_54_12]